ncbi:carbohydrate esterase family 4 protein [Diplodia corticola]|uniref:Carbohydrate esterase family 4 protein n=1 Tax=Diplodia corticola TaxID=236234 RepID=A0A1J9RAZ1_9PEZI|nr:carbohydrate esterase family 4 protein [Diplodia corticola]OJD37641.1 carbohydrate esterase family 4 protein [Diplodia corticola]
MHFTSLLATTAVAAVASAHGDGPEGIPKLFGRSAIADLKARNIFGGIPAQPDHHHAPIKRQDVGGTDGQCGEGYGSCNEGYCCSAAGWCGVGTDYCMSPDCQFNYGPACDANAMPAGDNTTSVTRDLKGSVEYGGAGIYDCVVNGQVALTYDDGPYIYTDGMLDVLKKYNAKATFFITGNNNGKGEIDNAAYGWDTVIKRMYSEGHQIASHTWSHQDLSAITSAQRKDQMIKNEMALRNILGFFPTYMRPPYSSCTAESGCEDDLKALGYHITYFDTDTDDYDNTTPDKIQNAKDNFSNALSGKDAASNDFLAIAHDIHQQTAQNLTEFMLQTLQAAGYTAVTVGECLGDDEANWYRSSSGSVFTSATSAVPTATSTTSTAPTATATKISEDATCGGTTGSTCKGSTFGDCCSPAGWCGSTDAYCGAGCQSAFGTCGSTTGQVSSISAVSTTISSVSSSSSTSGGASSPTSGANLKVSTDGTCGGTTGFTCTGSTFGDCCSAAGWCGSTSDYCGTGCNSEFGTCGTSSVTPSSPATGSSTGASTLTSSTVKASSPAASSSSIATTATTSTAIAPTATSKASTNGLCGSRNGGTTCAGSRFGGCCSILGTCGSSMFSCGLGCQKSFGSGCYF